MNKFIDNEHVTLLKKHNIPLELIDIIIEDSIRMDLDKRDTYLKGITFYSKDDGKFYAIKECIENILKNPKSSKYTHNLSLPGAIFYIGDKSKALESRNPENIIDLDNIDIEDEKKKSVFRYIGSYIGNDDIISKLNTEIMGLSDSYQKAKHIGEVVNNYDRIAKDYESKVRYIEESIIPNFFRRKRLDLYREKFYTYSNEKNKLNKAYNEKLEGIEDLLSSRNKNMHSIINKNNIIGQRTRKLSGYYGITQEEIKNQISKVLNSDKIPSRFLLLAERENYNKEMEK